MINNTLRRWRDRFAGKSTAQKGQSLIIITFAFLGLIAMLGLALDLGLVYIEQVRVSRTADAAALAGVVELPFEEEAMRRAIEYIELNGYQVGVDTEVRVRGCIEGSSGPTNVDGPGQTELDPEDIAQPTPADLTTGYTYRFAAQNPPRAVFVVDTLAYQPYDTDTAEPPNITSKNEDNCDTGLYGTANKLRVSGQVNVGMNFMQFFGFPRVPVSDRAVGENVTNLDVAVVFDVSGSMDFETTCYDCWIRDEARKYDPFPSNGTYYPVSYPNIVTANNLCSAAPQAATISGTSNSYQVVEAELFSEDYPRQGWRFESRNPGQGFWVIQRRNNDLVSGGHYIKTHTMTTYSQSDIRNNPQLQGMAYDSDCFKADGGRSVSYTCWESRANTIGETPSGQDPPYVEYDFQPTTTWNGDTTYVWIRAQSGGYYSDEWYGKSPRAHRSTQIPFYRQAVFWQMGPRDSDIMSWSQINGGQYQELDECTEVVSGNTKRLDGCGTNDNNDQNKDDRGYNRNWRWLKLGSFSTPSKTGWYTLRIFQGSTSFSMDRILFTDYDGGIEGTTIDINGNVRGGSVSSNFKSLLGQNSYKGPGATQGAATREACNVCNPIFGQTVNPSQCSCKLTHTDTGSGQFAGGGGGDNCTNVITTTVQTDSDLFHDIDPLRSAKEAVKNFAARLDPKFDQVGFVSFTTNTTSDPWADWRSELQCIRWATKNDPDGVKGCYDSASTPISYNNVIQVVEDTTNKSGTNIAQGMREGLEELGIGDDVVNHDCVDGIDDGSVCDRRGAARRILILMTDGSPNQNDDCTAPDLADLWQGNPGSGDKDYTCAMFYARLAANNNVTLYTIGIGSGVNRDLLTAMATGTDPTTQIEYFPERGGKYYPAANPSQLDAIFNQILSNVFVRIIG